jgi:hypothetical protein
MIQLVINTNMLREIDERKLINAYAKKVYESEKDIEDNDIIKINLTKLFDWDINGDNGLGVYCGKFESLKRKDWERLIQFIKDNKYEIKLISRPFIKEKKLENIKIINSALEIKEQHNIKRFSDENYQVSGRGKKARPCVYKGKEYKSRQECIYKEGITKYQLYEYLKNTKQL